MTFIETIHQEIGGLCDDCIEKRHRDFHLKRTAFCHLAGSGFCLPSGTHRKVNCMSRYIAAYDVSHPSQRRKLAHFLSGYGRRIQRSVFEVDIESEELSTLRRYVGSLLAKSDKFDLIPIDQSINRPRLSWQRKQTRQSSIFV